MKLLVARFRDENGFSLVELVVYILILAIIVSTAAYFFINMRNTSVINSSSQEVKIAMQRAINLAQSENQAITLTFYGSGTAGHPNSYAFFRAGGGAEKPATGTNYYLQGGVYYFKLQQGYSGLNIASDVTIVCSPQGTLMTITPGSVVVSYAGQTKTISVNANGDISY